MNWTDILLAAGILSGIGIVFGVVLGISAKKFYVEEDPRVEELRSCLGGANCGACGFAGCDAFAKALIEGQACPEDCTAASADNLEKMGQIMQVEVSEREPRVARVLCQGAFSVSKRDTTMRAIQAAALLLKWPAATSSAITLALVWATAQRNALLTL